jgi:hypothetical protein
MSYFIVWLRYTYGLNLADLLITAGVMTLFEAVAAKRVLVRTGMLLFGVSLLAAGAYSHVLLKKIISIPGAYVPSHFGYTTAALILAGISFLSLSRKAQLGQSAEGVVDRALRFAGIFALVGVLTRFIYLRLGFPLDYYLQKYVMYPGALAALALPLAFLRLHSRLTTSRLTQNAHAEFVTWLKQGASNPAIRNYGLLFGIVLVGPISFFAVLGIIQSNLLHSTTVFLVSGAWLAYLTWLWKDSKTHRNLSQLLLAVALPTVALSLFSAAEPYFESCTNRISRTPPFTKIGPLIDRDTLLLIQEKTTKHNSKFGGIIVPSWPMSNFMNAMLDYYGEYALYKKGTINRQQNSCVFWYANKEDFETYEKISPEVTTQVAQLESDPQKECQEHRRKWEPRDRAIQRVCFRCY